MGRCALNLLRHPAAIISLAAHLNVTFALVIRRSNIARRLCSETKQTNFSNVPSFSARPCKALFAVYLMTLNSMKRNAVKSHYETTAQCLEPFLNSVSSTCVTWGRDRSLEYPTNVPEKGDFHSTHSHLKCNSSSIATSVWLIAARRKEECSTHDKQVLQFLHSIIHWSKQSCLAIFSFWINHKHATYQILKYARNSFT